MSQACGDAYSRTLERWHGWLATFVLLGTYYSLSNSKLLNTSLQSQLAIKLAPDRTNKFMEIISVVQATSATLILTSKFCREPQVSGKLSPEYTTVRVTNTEFSEGQVFF